MQLILLICVTGNPVALSENYHITFMQKGIQ